LLQRVIMIIVILGIVLGGGYYAFQQLIPLPEQEMAGPVYSTQPVTRGDIRVGVDITGPLNPSRGGGLQVEYRPSSIGVSSYIIESLLVEEGDPVRQGQVVAVLDSPDLYSKIKNLEDEISSKRKYLADLLDVGVDELTGVNPARGITMRAPIDGRVIGLVVEEGTEVGQGQTVARIVDDSRFKMTVNMTSGEFKQAKKGELVILRFPQFDTMVEAKVVDINPNSMPMKSSELNLTADGSVNSGLESYEHIYKATIEGKNPGLIQPGMIAQVGFAGILAESSEKVDINNLDARWLRYRAKVDGFVKEERIFNRAEGIATVVYVREMEMVKAGDPIVSMAGKEVQQDIENRLEELRRLEADLFDLQSQIELLEVRAPMDGIVASIEKQPGQSLHPGEWFGYIYNTSDMRLWGQVDDVDVLLVQQGAPVQVTVDALPGKVFEGTVEMVDTMGTDHNGITRFGVNIKVVGSVELRPGMQAKAHVEAGSAENVLLVPLESIFEEDGQTKVEILESSGIPKVVSVQLGLMNHRVAEVKSGLEEGQLVITGSTADLLPSQRIKSNDILLPVNEESDGSQNSNANAESLN
jgi:HlyD family secretion protein